MSSMDLIVPVFLLLCILVPGATAVLYVINKPKVDARIQAGRNKEAKIFNDLPPLGQARVLRERWTLEIVGRMFAVLTTFIILFVILWVINPMVAVIAIGLSIIRFFTNVATRETVYKWVTPRNEQES